MSASRSSAGERRTLHFKRRNAVLLTAGVLTLALGYYMLAQGSTVAAPLLLVLGYVVLIPLALIL